MIRSPNWIGDAVMATAAMGAIRSTFPRAEITVMAAPLPAELFRYHPYCDRVMVCDKKGEHRGIAGFLQFSKSVRSKRFELAILLQNAIEAAILAFLSGIPRRLGYATDHRGLLLTDRVPIGDAERRLHHSEYYVHMLRSAGIEGGDGKLRLACSDEEIKWADAALEGDNWMAINPGASYGSAKRWFPERFAAVADHLAEAFGARIALTGGPGETVIGRDIETNMKTRCLNLVGKTSVRQLMAVISQCRLLITNDSGPMHVAAAFNIPIVAIFGPTDHTTTSPVNAASRIVRKPTHCAPCLRRHCPTDHHCMQSVMVDDVLAAVHSLLRTAS